MEQNRNLALTTLYVGATRAASYLAVTFGQKKPKLLEPLNSYFKTEE